MSREIGLMAVAMALALCSCKREERNYRVEPARAETVSAVRVSDLQPGTNIPSPPWKNSAEQAAAAISQGQKLYESFNCVGCHAHGGGGMGPALMDDTWLYGSKPQQVFASIVQGRPNGMPSFGGHIAENQLWELVAYVRSMSGLTPETARPNREDHMQGKPPEASQPKETPKNSAPPR
jgi:cytochrome c oxidase cbb3-type subunit III